MSEPIRFAVVGLGHISQVAVLPAFAHSHHARLTALISGDKEKLDTLGQRYGVEILGSYDDYERVLQSGEVDAVYIALPNHLHCEYTERAARARIHVLCEKPMAVSEDECQRMMDTCQSHNVRLMVAYRLHYEPANLRAVELATDGTLGDVRLFTSTFCMDVKEGNIRLKFNGGGTLFDIGIYCINAARYLFRSEPIELLAASAKRDDDSRFHAVDEMTSLILRFPDDRVACFATSFGASSVGDYRLVGTRGHLHLDPSYEYVGAKVLTLVVGDEKRTEKFGQSDQFAALIDRFCEAVRAGVDPEPDGVEGLADVRIIRAAFQSAETGKTVRLQPVAQSDRPRPGGKLWHPPVREKPEEIHASSPGRQ